MSKGRRECGRTSKITGRGKFAWGRNETSTFNSVNDEIWQPVYVQYFVSVLVRKCTFFSPVHIHYTVFCVCPRRSQLYLVSLLSLVCLVSCLSSLVLGSQKGSIRGEGDGKKSNE